MAVFPNNSAYTEKLLFFIFYKFHSVRDFYFQETFIHLLSSVPLLTSENIFSEKVLRSVFQVEPIRNFLNFFDPYFKFNYLQK